MFNQHYTSFIINLLVTSKNIIQNITMNTLNYSHTTVFRDSKKNCWHVTLELRPCVSNIEVHSHIVSIVGEGLNSCGQVLDSILPRTKTQKDLCDFWKTNHMCTIHDEDSILEWIIQRWDEICNAIDSEEKEYTAWLGMRIDMGSREFIADSEEVQKVQTLRKCSYQEAVRFLALGMHLECTVGDLNDTFSEVGEGDNLYCANGVEYYVGTEDELYDVAERMLFEYGDYDDLWREAVRSQETELGLQDWLQLVLDTDGWCSILNKWDGKYDEYFVDGRYICVSRS